MQDLLSLSRVSARHTARESHVAWLLSSHPWGSSTRLPECVKGERAKHTTAGGIVQNRCMRAHTLVHTKRVSSMFQRRPAINISIVHLPLLGTAHINPMSHGGKTRIIIPRVIQRQNTKPGVEAFRVMTEIWWWTSRARACSQFPVPGGVNAVSRTRQTSIRAFSSCVFCTRSPPGRKQTWHPPQVALLLFLSRKIRNQASFGSRQPFERL